ncbi:pyruvate formate lyase activating enzyme [Lachnotalea glycerini]|uniref:Anaerobic ribonucleoside-triphosphate reductase activating protein n=1 Tax=Lachnotalea glycerini TaxID=1763509 RepID=A0A255IM21_9FIRM|nr:anaerobic ribonucleoside-triphosphate reductase activating protein [Lachnotalea glycerini]PXV84916.1 pyruvate formate lyase activating enzyme [Lachnotalea glycerini]RDY29905.1 anaerobic ribonucleoside-triphosphate reductase activating protein [Lachnotalea glycerini]
MQIHGFNKTTLLDYPGHLASTVFLGNCNFRCPFCHNRGLVLCPEKEPVIPTELVLEHINKRKNILEGICITGGEPTLSSDLYEFISQIKRVGLLVKLDTNGYRPEMLSALMKDHMLDYIAMDIKSSYENYYKVAGLDRLDMNKIDNSIHMIMESGIDYEFRTTLIKELHSMDDINQIGEWIKGCKSYFLQAYRENENVINPIFTSFSKDELLVFQQHLSKYMKHVQIRGID